MKAKLAIYELIQVLQISKQLKKMMFIVHQNFLLIAQVVIGRLPQASSNNFWAHSLLAQILNKQVHSFKIQNCFQKRKYDYEIST